MIGLIIIGICIIGKVGYALSQAYEDSKTREEYRSEGREYYWANDGLRRVSDNHKIVRGDFGIVDATTGEYIVNPRDLERQKKREIDEENKVSKQEAIIKGEEIYSFKRYVGGKNQDWEYHTRLVKNDLLVKGASHRRRWFPGKKDPLSTFEGSDEKKIYEEYTFKERKYHKYNLYKEENFGFSYPMQCTKEELDGNNNWLLERDKDMIEARGIYPILYYEVPDDGWQEIINACKKKNIEKLVGCINIRPINQIKWMHQYCFKYGIPMGTWEEVEAACWEEHPVKWGKPEEESWSFKKWFLDVYDF